jgi:hypothetical protein
VTALDPRDPVALEAALEAQTEGRWAEVTVEGERLLIVRVSGGWHLPGDLAVSSGDIVDGRPTAVVILGGDGRLSAPAAIGQARAAFARARAEQAWEGAAALTGELDDLDSSGWDEAGALRDEIHRWLDLFGEDPGDVTGWSLC